MLLGKLVMYLTACQIATLGDSAEVTQLPKVANPFNKLIPQAAKEYARMSNCGTFQIFL